METLLNERPLMQQTLGEIAVEIRPFVIPCGI